MKKKFLFILAGLLLLPTSLSSCGETGQVHDYKLDVSKVQISINNVTLAIGNTIQLQASVYDYNDEEMNYMPVSWHSSNQNVAKVTDTGFIVALAPGRSYISAISGYKVDICVVSVPNPDVPIEDEFIISETDFTIKTGSSKQLYTSLNGGNVVSSWESSNPNVVMVNSEGLITAIQSGTSNITATYEEYVASITVTVKDDAPEIFSIKLNTTNLAMVVGEKVLLEATTSSPCDITWRSDNEVVASVDQNGYVRAIKAGKAGIIAEAKGKTAQCFVEVSDGSDEDKDVDVFFYLDYNNVDEEDSNKLIASFKWYQNVPLIGCPDIPQDLDSSLASDPAFPYFIGWSSHTIIDSKDDLWDIENDVISGTYHMNLYGIWSDIPKEEFVK